ncbi:MAG: hypothetical protein MJ108_06995 [Saccharofermentans sp.]|nr:hypothetical protein [Saccharofermentans sp.]
MEHNDNNFFRMPSSDEQSRIKGNEEERYGREIKAIRTLLIVEGIAAVASILGFFLPIGIGLSRRIILLAIDAFLLYITLTSLNITNRQRRKINGGSYRVQNVTVAKTHQESHGLKSDMIVTFVSDENKTYVMNTNTTCDMVFERGAKGLLVVIDDEKNVLLTNMYRFLVTRS